MKDKLTAADLALYLGQECKVFLAGGFQAKTFLNRIPLTHVDFGGNLLEIIDIKPILRPLSDLTSDEENRLVQILDLMPEPEGVPYKDSVIAKIPCLSHAVNYLRSQGFDTDDWIPAGLAIDKTKLQTP